MEVKLESVSDVGPQPSRPCRPDGNAACRRHVVSGSRPRVRPQLKNEGIFTIHAVAQNLCCSAPRKQNHAVAITNGAGPSLRPQGFFRRSSDIDSALIPLLLPHLFQIDSF